MIKIVIFCFILMLLSTYFVDGTQGHGIPIWKKFIGGEIKTIVGDRKTAKDPNGNAKVIYPILDTVGDGWKSVFKTEDENKVAYVIKVEDKRSTHSENSLDHENEVLTKLKELAQGKPLDVGIVDQFDYIKYGVLYPPKINVSIETTGFTCNAVVETLLDTDIWRHVKPHTYEREWWNLYPLLHKTSIKQMFTYIYQLLGTLKFIHDNGYMHNDVDPLNAGLKNGKLVLFDFELATKLDHENLIYIDEMPSGEKIPLGLRRVLPVEALKCEKRTIIMQLKSAVFFGFVLFGRIVWDVKYIDYLFYDERTFTRGIERIIELHKDFPIGSLIAYYENTANYWNPLCNEAFKKMWAAAEKGNHEDMRTACKIVIDAK